MADTSRGTSPKSDHHIHGFAKVAKALTNPDNVATWVQITIPETYSGYKAHIYCKDPEDVIWVLRRIWDVIADLQLGAKAGTMRFFELTQPDDAGNPHPQAGKAVVYFPRRRTWRQDLQRICDALEGSRHDDKGIVGANVERNGVSWRFELTYDPGEDVDRARYLKLYQPAWEPGRQAAERTAPLRRRLPHGPDPTLPLARTQDRRQGQVICTSPR